MIKLNSKTLIATVLVMGMGSAIAQNASQQSTNPQDVKQVEKKPFFGSAPPITSTAPQFLPKSAGVSAYGTPLVYDANGSVIQSPQQNSSTGSTLPNRLPDLPTGAVSVEQVLQEGGLVLSPEQIRDLHIKIDRMGRAAAEDPNGAPPRPETSSVVASLTPGSTPPVVRIYMNYPTSLVVVDSAGNPWPVDNWAGGSKNIEIKRPTAKDSIEGASITMTPLTPTGKYTHGGMTLYLKGLAVPVSLTYVGGQPVVDTRVEIRIPARGPNTTAPSSVGVGPAANPSLLSLIDGVAPQGAKSLKVMGAASAWSIGENRMLVRTPLTIISPGYISGMKSADGTNVYEMEQVSELRALNAGQIVSISIDY